MMIGKRLRWLMGELLPGEFRMNRNDLEKFRRHLGQGKEYEIGEGDSRDTFYFEPLPNKYLPEFFYLIDKTNKQSESNDWDFDEEAVKIFLKLITATCINAFPDATDIEIERFISKNYVRLQEIVTELNGDIGQNQLSKESIEKIEEFKKRMNK